MRCRAVTLGVHCVVAFAGLDDIGGVGLFLVGEGEEGEFNFFK